MWMKFKSNFESTVNVGSQLIAALENGVSQYPKHEGRFPQVSGMKFCFDPDCEAYHRIVKDSILVGNEPLEENKVCIGIFNLTDQSLCS